MDSVKSVRLKEKEYHENLYINQELFSNGSWLFKPVRTVLDSFDLIEKKDNLTILDIGSGVGRNAIPLAQRLKDNKSKIICIDMLEIAINKLNENAKKYNVEKFIDAQQSTIEDYDITSNQYDFVVAVSALEHLEKKDFLIKKLSDIALNTKPCGINCFIVNTSVKEILVENGNEIKPQFEINLSTEEMNELLDSVYYGWEVMKRTYNNQQYKIIRDNKEVILNTNVLTYVVRKV